MNKKSLPWVYMMRVQMSFEKNKSYIKFGRSYDPRARLETLQTGSPWKLTLIGTYQCRSIANAIYVEKCIHKELISYQSQHGGTEWFDRVPVAKIIHSLISSDKRANGEQTQRDYPMLAEFLSRAINHDTRPFGREEIPMHRWRV